MKLDVSLLPLSQEQRQKVLWRIGPLFQDCLRRYTLGDQTSLRVETAQYVFESLCFVLSQAADCLDGDLFAAYQTGRQRLLDKAAEGRRLWRACMETLPKARSDAMLTTLQSVGAFLRHEDFTSPDLDCAMDYPLLLPVPENLRGMDYLLEWLRRLLAENKLMKSFSADEQQALLRRYCADYEDLPVNLCDPVLMAAVGARLLGENTLLLNLEQRRALARQLCNAQDVCQSLLDAARCTADAAGLDDFETQYLCQAAAGAAYRILQVGVEDVASGVFC